MKAWRHLALTNKDEDGAGGDDDGLPAKDDEGLPAKASDADDEIGGASQHGFSDGDDDDGSADDETARDRRQLCAVPVLASIALDGNCQQRDTAHGQKDSSGQSASAIPSAITSSARLSKHTRPNQKTSCQEDRQSAA